MSGFHVPVITCAHVSTLAPREVREMSISQYNLVARSLKLFHGGGALRASRSGLHPPHPLLVRDAERYLRTLPGCECQNDAKRHRKSIDSFALTNAFWPSKSGSHFQINE